jgi:hypothetical protein
VGGEYESAAYFLDPEMILSGSVPDILAEVARRTDARVVGCGAETVSGTFWLDVFDGCSVIRRVWVCHCDLGVPFTYGAALASEHTCPLDSGWDGEGVMAALRQLGFDYQSWSQGSSYHLFTLDHAFASTAGPLEHCLKEHYDRHRLPADQQPPICVVQRPASSNLDITVSSPPTRPAKSFWRSLLHVLGVRR